MGLLEDHEISWRYNLSRAPWWGGQFERLVAVIKEAFYKTVGGGTLTWTELAEVILDVETQINRRPLTYVEDDVELPLLTPQTFLYQRSTQLPEQATHQIKGSYFIPKKITTSDFVYPKKSLLFLAYPKKSLRSFFATQENPGVFHRPQKITLGQNFRPQKITRTPPRLKYVSGTPGTNSLILSHSAHSPRWRRKA